MPQLVVARDPLAKPASVRVIDNDPVMKQVAFDVAEKFLEAIDLRLVSSPSRRRSSIRGEIDNSAGAMATDMVRASKTEGERSEKFRLPYSTPRESKWPIAPRSFDLFSAIVGATRAGELGPDEA